MCLMKQKTTGKLYLIVCVLVCLSGSVCAIDGQIDVLPDGTTPFDISSPGSYVLVVSVTMTADVDCIRIKASDVTLDLNGHTLTGTGTGTGVGVHQKTGARAKVFNGTIYNFGGSGIRLGAYGNIRDLSVSNCGGDASYPHAVWVANYSVVRRVSATHNHGNGIYTGSWCLVEDCVASHNGTVDHKGIAVGTGSKVQDCVASYNGHNGTVASSGTGIHGHGPGVTLLRNSCFGNSGHGEGIGYGIQVSWGNLVMHNNCRNNHGAGSSSGHGIYCTGDSTISYNTCQENWGQGEDSYGLGIRVGYNSTVSHNTCVYNNGNHAGGQGSWGCGIYVANNGNNIFSNTCDYNRGNGSRDAFGIQVAGHHNRIEGNTMTRQTGGSGFRVGLVVNGDRNYIINNTFSGNTSGSIRFTGSNNYYAANLYPAAEGILPGGSGNVDGTMPGANTSTP